MTDLAPRQLAALYGDAALVVGVRLHAVILAMAGGAPVFAVDYFTDKTQGILEMAGLSDSWCRYDEFTADAVLGRWDELVSPARRDRIQRTVKESQRQLEAWIRCG